MKFESTSIDGTPTRYIVGGRAGAYPILLLHGLTMNAEIWLRNIDKLAEDFYVVAPDLLGHGFSGPLPDEQGPLIRRKVRHLGLLADALGFDRYCVCGSSYGGLIGALLYFDQPDRVDRLVINGSGSCFNSDAQLTSNMRSTLETVGPHLATASADFWRARVQRGFHDPSKAPLEMVTSLLASFAQPWAISCWRTTVTELLDLESTRPFRILHRLEQLEVQTRVIWGRNDPGAHLENAVAAIKRMPAADLTVVEECGHFPMLEHSAQFNELIKDFLIGKVR